MNFQEDIDKIIRCAEEGYSRYSNDIIDAGIRFPTLEFRNGIKTQIRTSHGRKAYWIWYGNEAWAFGDIDTFIDYLLYSLNRM